MRIREAGIEDAEAIAELSGELGYPASPLQAVDRLASLIGRPEHGVFVALAPGGAVIGWIHVFVTRLVASDPFAELGGLVVTRADRGRGVGKQLLAVAERWADRRGIDRLRIRSRSTRADAHAFYQRLGYRVEKTQHVFEKRLGRKP